MRNVNVRFARLRPAALLCLLLALLIPAAALAIDPMDESRLCSLTLRYDHEGTAIAGAKFTLYRVADSDEFSEFTFCGAFEGYSYLNVHDYTSSQWNDLAVQLAAFVADSGVTQGRLTGETGADGVVTFDGLAKGLYLLLGEKTAQGDKYYTAAPALVALPDRDENDHWVYDHTIAPKPGVTDRPLTSLRVIKIWDDDDNEHGKRPSSIVVDLKHRGQVVDYVVLSDDNSWRHIWQELEGDAYEWTAVERDAPPGYETPKSETRPDKDGNTVVITNTYDEPPTHTHTKLPQTGLPWWPVAALALSGMLLFFLGWAKRRNYEED